MKWTLELATLGGPIEVTDESGRVVAYINTSTRGVKDPKEAERIGRLVAAAPELLEALEDVLDFHLSDEFPGYPALVARAKGEEAAR